MQNETQVTSVNLDLASPISILNFDVPHLRVLDAVFRASPDTILVIDRAGRYVYVGVTSARVMGMPPEAMLGKTFLDLGVSPELCAEIARLRDRVFVTGQPVNGEIPLPTAAGTRDFEFTLSPVLDDNRDIQAVLCIGRDITQRKQAEAERDALYSQTACQSAELRAVIDSIADAVYIGGETGITVCNQPALDMLGFASLAELNRNIAALGEQLQNRDVKTGQRIPAEDEPFARALRGERVIREVLTRNVSSGHDLVVRCAAAPILQNGVIVGAVAVNTDITSETRFNARLVRAMQETHHRIKNNLQIIAAMLDISMAEHGDTLPVSDGRRVQQQIMMLARIHDLLTASAMSAGQQPDSVSVRQLLTRLLAMLNSTVGRHQLSHDIEDVQLPVQKMTSLGLIVNELAGNAIKHGQGKVHTSFRVEGQMARLVVENDGPGIPPGFDFRAGANTGLTLVDTLVGHDLDGIIEFTNRSTGGTRVDVTFRLSG